MQNESPEKGGFQTSPRRSEEEGECKEQEEAEGREGCIRMGEKNRS